MPDEPDADPVAEDETDDDPLEVALDVALEVTLDDAEVGGTGALDVGDDDEPDVLPLGVQAAAVAATVARPANRRMSRRAGLLSTM